MGTYRPVPVNMKCGKQPLVNLLWGTAVHSDQRHAHSTHAALSTRQKSSL
jgi:hypothetical protein